MAKFTGFFKDVYGEMQKVVWPSRKQTFIYLIQVVVFCLVVAVILGAADFGLLQLFTKVIK